MMIVFDLDTRSRLSYSWYKSFSSTNSQIFLTGPKDCLLGYLQVRQYLKSMRIVAAEANCLTYHLRID